MYIIQFACVPMCYRCRTNVEESNARLGSDLFSKHLKRYRTWEHNVEQPRVGFLVMNHLSGHFIVYNYKGGCLRTTAYLCFRHRLLGGVLELSHSSIRCFSTSQQRSCTWAGVSSASRHPQQKGVLSTVLSSSRVGAISNLLGLVIFSFTRMTFFFKFKKRRSKNALALWPLCTDSSRTVERRLATSIARAGCSPIQVILCPGGVALGLL